MADIRINALATTAASTASDDFIAVDGSANGTRKLNAYSPTFGGNLTVSGGKVLISYPSSSQARVSFGGAHFDANSSYASYIRGYSSSATTAGLDFYTTYGSSVLALSLSEQGNATLAGNLTVSGGTISSGTASLTLKSTASTVLLQSAGTTALTLDSSQNATFEKNINAGGASNDADIRLHLTAAGDTSAKFAALWRNASYNKIFHLRADGDLYTSAGATITGAIAIGNTVQTAAAVASTHKVTISIGGTTYYLLATNV